MMGLSGGSIKATRQPCRADPREDGPHVGLSTIVPATPLDAALAYYSLGWSVIPVPYGSKATRVSWKPYMTHAPDETQLRAWFNGQPTNMAVVLGAVSGNLACRDFDDPALYHHWAESHPDLARVLPTVKTHRGYHVYFKVVNPPPTRVIEGGELRGEGSYVLLPPSIHPAGRPYVWMNPPRPQNLLQVDDRETALSPPSAHTPSTSYTLPLPPHLIESPLVSSGLSDLSGLSVNHVADLIQRTLPSEFGTRHRKIFEFARHLKSMPEYSDCDPRNLRLIVREWHRQALPFIRTQEFEETWCDFVQGWQRVKYKVGDEPVTRLLAKAKVTGPPRIAYDLYPDNEQIRLLTALCAELQRRRGEKPFFLSYRVAGRLLGCSHAKAGTYLRVLVIDGLLELVEKGGATKNPRRASRYRYRAEISDAPGSRSPKPCDDGWIAPAARPTQPP